MGKSSLDKALDKYLQDFGFSFGSLLDEPDRYQLRISKKEESEALNEDTRYFSQIYDKAQIELYK